MAWGHVRNQQGHTLYSLKIAKVKGFTLRKEPQVIMLILLGNLFPHGMHFIVLSHPGTQRVLQPWYKGSWQLLVPWYHPSGAGFTDIQNSRVLGTWKFPSIFQKKAWEAGQCALRRQQEAVKVKYNGDPKKLEKTRTWNTEGSWTVWQEANRRGLESQNHQT